MIPLPLFQNCRRVTYNCMKQKVITTTIKTMLDIPLHISTLEEISDELVDNLIPPQPETVEACITIEDGTENTAVASSIKLRRIPKLMIPHPLYFCMSCNKDVCKDCFAKVCISHNVIWVGNSTFICTCLYQQNIAH